MVDYREVPLAAFGSKSIVRIRDIDAVVHNYRIFADRVAQTDTVCGVVLKGDVHGLSMAAVAPALYEAGCSCYFVEEIAEGIELRGFLPQSDARIYAMAGLLDGEEAYFADHDVTPCLNDLDQIERWNRFCGLNGRRGAVIHLDTHMNRLGLLDGDVDKLADGFDELTGHLDVEFYMSHFADIKGDDASGCLRQLDVLNGYLAELPPRPVSFSATDATILLDNQIFDFDIVRIGVGLIGGAPSASRPVSPDAESALEIYAKLSQIKWVAAGQPVGYGGAYVTKRDTKLALAHIGYKDGYLRALSETDAKPVGAFMCVGGYRAPVIGKVSMGMTTLDVTDVPDDVLKRCCCAEVVGPNVDMKQLADLGGCYEVLVALGRPNLKCADFTLREFESGFGSMR